MEGKLTLLDRVFVLVRCQITLATTVSFGFGAVFKFLFTFFIFPIWHKHFVWSVALYGSETWTLQKEDIRRLEAFEIWIWRRIIYDESTVD